MKQTKLAEKHEQLSGRMQSAYKKEIEKYKADIASGKIKAPVFPEVVMKQAKKKEKFEIKHNEIKETEQARLS